MAFLPSTQAQPGDGAWLVLQNGSAVAPQQRRGRGTRSPSTFLARRDDVVVDSDQQQQHHHHQNQHQHVHHHHQNQHQHVHRHHQNQHQHQHVHHQNQHQHQHVHHYHHHNHNHVHAASLRNDNRGPSPVNNAKTWDNRSFVSSGGGGTFGTCHRYPQRTRQQNHFTRRGLQPQLSSFLYTPPPTQPHHAAPSEAQPHHNLPPSDSQPIAAMPPANAIPPHRRMNRAAAPGSFAALLPHRPPIEQEPSEHVAVGASPDADSIPDGTGWSMVNESLDSSLPNPESLAGPVQQVSRGQANPPNNRRRRAGGNSRTSHRNPAHTTTPHRGSAFCRGRDVPRGDPMRWEPDWSGNNHGYSDQLHVATYHTKPVKEGTEDCWGHPGPSRGGGHWIVQDCYSRLPPEPMTWDFRPAFRTGQNEKQIQNWVNMMENYALADVVREPNLEDLPVDGGFIYTFGSPPEDAKEGAEYRTMGEIVPHYWKRDHFYGKVPLSTFFDQNLKSGTPGPLDEEDILNARPWWEKLVEGGNFLQPQIAPEINGIDPDESIRDRLARDCDYGSQHHAENTKRRELAKQGISLARMRRRAEKNEKREALMHAYGGSIPEHLGQIKDSRLGKTYLRHASSSDMEAVCDIFNYYVDFSPSVRETERVTVMSLHQQFIDITQHRKLPYLVAYRKGSVLRAPSGRPGSPLQLPDTIVGFIRADEHRSGTDTHRSTVVVELFIHKDYLMKSIAKCLMDQMLSLLDPYHTERGGYLADEDLEAAQPVSNIENVMVNYFYPSEKPERLQRLGRWLVQDLQFEELGTLPDIGSKLTRPISQAIFVREISAVQGLGHAGPAKRR